MDEKTTKYIYNEIVVKDPTALAHKLCKLNRKVSKQRRGFIFSVALFTVAAYIAHTRMEKLTYEMDILTRKMEALEDTKGE